MNRRHPTVSLLLAAVLIAVVGVVPVAAEIPEADHTVFGLAKRNGLLVTTGVVTFGLGEDPTPFATYTLGTTPSFGDRYVFRLPMDSVDLRAPGKLREGDIAKLYLDGELAAELEVGAPGTTQQVEIDPFFDEAALLSVPAETAVLEGDTGLTPLVVRVELSRPLLADVGLSYATADGSALAGEDYVAASGQLVVPAGEIGVDLTLEIMGDTEVEEPEDFWLDLSDPTGAEIAPGAGRARIVIDPDDRQWVIRIADAEALEGDGPDPTTLRFLVTVEPGAPPIGLRSLDPRVEPVGDVTLDFASADGTATAGVDYTAISGPLLVPTGVPCPVAGESRPCAEIVVDVLPDTVSEGPETLTISLANPSSNAAMAVSSAVGTIRSDDLLLVYIDARKEGDDCDDCLRGPRSAVLSPDGGHLYTAASLDSAIAVHARDQVTAELDFVASVVDGIGGVDGLAGVQGLAFDPTGSHLYAAGYLEDEVALFARDPGTGGLTYDGVFTAPPGDLKRPNALAVSPDGAFLYASGKTSNSLAIFARDPGTGALTPAGVVVDGDVQPDFVLVDGLLEPRALVISGDGAHLYAVSAVDASLLVFERDPGTGQLSLQQVVRDALSTTPGGAPVDGLDGAVAVATSPDGKNLYVAGELDDAIAIFSRDHDELSPDFGKVQYRGRKRNLLGGVTGLDGAAAVSVSSEGGYVFAASRFDHALVVFARDAATGDLSFIEDRRDGDLATRGPIDGLEGGLWIAPSLDGDARHIYVAGGEDDGLAIFFKDLTEPEAPSFDVPTPSGHEPGVWSQNPNLVVGWRTTDDPLGIGLAGYARLFDRNPQTDPGTTLDQLHDPNADPQTAAADLVDAVDHYVHVRACDLADNCSPAVPGFGPFLIDTVPPETPVLTSPSHGTGDWSNDPFVELTWSSVDPDPTGNSANSGVAGYELLWTGASDTACTRTANLGPVSGATTELADGDWWAHLCAVDLAGNWSPAGRLGPFRIDTVPPRVLSTRTVAAQPGGVEGDPASFARAPTGLLLDFDSELVDPTVPSGYALIAAGENGAVQTTDCGAVAGDDVAVALDAPILEAGSGTVGLLVEDLFALPRGLYRILACGDAGGLADPAGNLLDGDGDGIGGDPYALSFEVRETNLLANPDFDGVFDGWTLSDLDVVLDTAVDADALAPFSGAARIEATDGLRAVSQCVDLDPGVWLRLAFSSRIDGASAAGPEVFGAMELFPNPGCGADTLGTPVTPALVGDTGGSWTELDSPLFQAPAGTLSARVLLIVDPATDGGTVFLDRATLTRVEVVFLDGFETGDTARWSSTTGGTP